MSQPIENTKANNVPNFWFFSQHLKDVKFRIVGLIKHQTELAYDIYFEHLQTFEIYHMYGQTEKLADCHWSNGIFTFPTKIDDALPQLDLKPKHDTDDIVTIMSSPISCNIHNKAQPHVTKVTNQKNETLIYGDAFRGDSMYPEGSFVVYENFFN